MTVRYEPDNRFRRAPRPLIGWLYFAVGLASFVFLILLAGIVLKAVNRWAEGEHVDWMGFAAIASVAAGALGPIIAQGAQWMNQRHLERIEQTRAGVAPPPFASSPPEGGPRPGDSL